LPPGALGEEGAGGLERPEHRLVEQVAGPERAAAREVFGHRVELVPEERHDGAEEELHLPRSLHRGRLGAARAGARSGVGRHGRAPRVERARSADALLRPSVAGGVALAPALGAGSLVVRWRARMLARGPLRRQAAEDRVGGAEGPICPSLVASGPDLMTVRRFLVFAHLNPVRAVVIQPQDPVSSGRPEVTPTVVEELQ
jgi:hypothetical protein